jgi:O-antigen ligase
MKTTMHHIPLTQNNAGGIAALALSGLALVVILFGTSTAVLDWDLQAIVLTALVPALLLLYDYRIGLALLIFILPFENAQILPKIGPLNALNVLILGVVLAFLLQVAMRKLTARPMAVLVPRTLFLYYVVPVTVAVIVGSFHFKEIGRLYVLNNFPDGYTLANYWVSHYFKHLLLVAVACVIASTVFEAGTGRKIILMALLAPMVFVVAQMIITAQSGLDAYRLQSARAFLVILGRQNNEAGVMLVTALGPMLFMREAVRGFWPRVALTLAAILVMIAIVLTGSRGAFVAMAAIIGLYLLHFRRLRTAFFVLTLAVGAVAIAPDAVQERLLRGLENRRIESIGSRGDELTAGRVYVWQSLAPEIKRSPLYGRGLLSTQWSQYVRSGAFMANHPHNVYLEILMDAGIYGATCMFIFYRFVWRTFRRLGKDERLDPDVRSYFLGAWAGFVGMLVYGLTNGHWFPAPEQVFFWIAVGLAIGYTRFAERLPQPSPVSVAPRRGALRRRHTAGTLAPGTARAWR